MKTKLSNRFAASALALAATFTATATAADLFWDGGNVGGNGDGNGTYAGGTWSTSNANWDQGPDLSRVPWNNANLDTAVFAGTFVAGGRVITIGSDIAVNQIQVLTGSTGGNRYDFGASAAQNDFAITFGGTYSADFPAITGNSSFANTQFNAKITGDLSASGGLVIKHGSDITTPATSGRLALLNANNDFIGDIVVAGGLLGATTAHQVGYGNSANKVVLNGGALLLSNAAAIAVVLSRDIRIDGTSGISTNSTTSGVQSLDLTGTITGAGDLIRYSSATGSSTSELRLSGSMSGYTGMFEARAGGSATTNVVIQTTSTSGGSWKLTGGTVRLNTIDDTHIANGVGKSDLLMNGGTLDMNGKSETINGLNGATGTVTNRLTGTEATLTLGDGDADAVFGGTLSDGAGTLALTKIGTGAQTVGNATHSGATLVTAGTLATTGSMAQSSINVATGASFIVTAPGKDLGSLTLENGSTFSAPLPPLGSLDYLLVRDTLTLANGGTITMVPTFSEAPELGIYEFILSNQTISGTGTIAVDFSGNGATRIDGTGQVDGDLITINITTLGSNLVWGNGGNTGVWGVDGDANFLIGAAASNFLQYDHVTFGPSSPSGTIGLTGTLLPASVTVNSSENFTFAGSGDIAGFASLTKSGTGTLTINNTNSSSGDTTVTAGILAINGALGGGDLTVDPGATLTGVGTVGGFAFIDGTVAPGNGIGSISLGATTLTGTYQCDLDGSQADLLAVTGNLNLAGATLAVNLINPAAKDSYLIATYTGSFAGTFLTAPAGYVVDTSSPGQVFLWQESATLPPAGAITFEQNQGYPASGGAIAASDSGITTDRPFDGVNGWSRSSSNAAAVNRPTGSSGEYFGGLAIGSADANTYIGAKLGSIAATGANTIAFDAPFFAGTQVGLFKDLDEDGLFDGNPEIGMAFGIGGSPARFQYRNAAAGAEIFGPGFVGIAGHWYRFAITISESNDSQRTITFAARNLTTGEDYDFDAATEGTQPWSFTVTDAQFGFAPELADGIFIRTTGSARIDNLLITRVAPPVGVGYAEWALANGVTGGIDGDHDNDGVANGIEFFMGESGSGFTALPSLDADRRIVWTMGNDYTGTYGPAADYVIETSTTLNGWTPAPAGQVQFNGKDVSYSLPAGEDKIFTRLKVMGPQ